MKIEFTVPGEAKGKGRPRFSTAGKYPKAYTPKETASYENLVRVIYMDGGYQKFDGAVKVSITAYFQPPSSASKKKRAEMLNGIIPCVKKPDADNIGKLICDALNGFAYDDDKQVVELEVAKRYGATAKVDVVLTEWGTEDAEKIKRS